MARRRGMAVFWGLALLAGCTTIKACPSPAGGACDPRDANCPVGYYCAKAEVCTRKCTQTSDCWVKVTDGCYTNALPGQLLPDGGVYVEGTPDGYCEDTKVLLCVDGYCQKPQCAQDGGCDYDLYGPSPFKGTRTQGPLN